MSDTAITVFGLVLAVVGTMFLWAELTVWRGRSSGLSGYRAAAGWFAISEGWRVFQESASGKPVSRFHTVFYSVLGSAIGAMLLVGGVAMVVLDATGFYG